MNSKLILYYSALAPFLFGHTHLIPILERTLGTAGNLSNTFNGGNLVWPGS